MTTKAHAWNPLLSSLACIALFGAGCGRSIRTTPTGAPAVSVTAPATDSVSALHTALSRTIREKLANGATILFLEDHSAPVVSIQIWIGTGSIHEQEYLGCGISHAIEHMIFKGTERRGIGAITREINDAGGRINAYTTLDRTVFHTDLPSRHFQVGLDVLSDAVFNATFPEEEWKKERDVILREIAMGQDDPGRLLSYLASETALKVHPSRVPVIGYQEGFKGLSRDDLVRFARRNYVPDNMIIAVAGNVPATSGIAAIKAAFGTAPRRAHAAAVLPKEPEQTSPRLARRAGVFNVSRLSWSYPSVPMHHPDAVALDMLASVTGHGRSSRLTNRLREQRQLVNSIGAWSYTPKDNGMFGISATFMPEREAEVTNAVAEEIQSWVSYGFNGEEVEKARRQSLVSGLAELETMHGMADSIASGVFYADDPAYTAVYLRSLSSITPMDLQNVARRYLVPERLSLAILSPTVSNATTSASVSATGGIVVVRSVLPNGMPLIVREDHRLPFVHMALVARGGLLSETEELNGITRLTAELLTRGTARRSAADVALAVESMGAGLSSFSGNNSLGMRAKCMKEDLPAIMNLMAECITQAIFSDEEIERQRRLQLAAIAQEREQPMYAARQGLLSNLFRGHPYKLQLNGTTGSVSRITRADIVSFAEKHLTTSNMVLSCFGDITPAEAARLAESALSSARRTPFTPPAVTPASPSLPIRVETTEPREQAIVLAGFPGVRVGDPAEDALSVLATALSGLSSTLSEEIREKRGLAYYCGAYQQTGLHPGAFVLYAGTKADAVTQVLDILDAEVKRVVTSGITQEELDRARNQILADSEMDWQDNGELAMTSALNELYGLGYSYALDAPKRISALTVADITKAAASVLNTNRLAVSIVRPASAK